MPVRKLSQMQCGEIRRLRAEVNDWGEPKYTGLEIAIRVGCSEGTVWRVLGKQAAYAKMDKVEPGGLSFEAAGVALTLAPVNGMEEEIAASLARLMERQGRPLPWAEPALRREMPPSLLDRADAPSEAAGEGLSALEERARAYGVDIEKLRAPIISR